MSSGATDPNEAVRKHRACDECRMLELLRRPFETSRLTMAIGIRKLACTKEPDGCSRCRREGTPCRYSPQRPMGRPRKRPREEIDERSASGTPPTKAPMTEQPPDTEDPGMDFINLLLGADFNFDMSTIQPLETTAAETATPVYGQHWDYTRFGEVNFDSPTAEHTTSHSPANIDPALFAARAGLNPPPADQVPALSPPNSNTTSSPQSSSTGSAGATPRVPNCDCTATLYSALACMQKIPSEVEPAIRQARLAAKTAYEVVNCPSCSFRLDPPGHNQLESFEMMRGFQNMMLLGTLIPSIVQAYAQMLAIVDEETNRAVAERRKVVFQLTGLGGIWGRFADEDEDLCGARRNFNYREMEPVMWRLAVRALLKIDVYGISGCRGSEATVADPFHLGLKDIVLLMENKSKARHALLDAMVGAGVWQPPNCVFSSHKPGETPTCQRIISIARSSVEQLYIA
ncbi:putative c6 finger domain-containing protein [Rosellinia necatrix]|uniref:Putative c6 finger domain-containing protein n=1 Tax=Rosellinia necatrix TaxID=77044 RepID=A0A1W2TGV8_ROSNE|nr:putative c6 finger domain-containing protein [Rosellinia necatrix]